MKWKFSTETQSNNEQKVGDYTKSILSNCMLLLWDIFA